MRKDSLLKIVILITLLIAIVVNIYTQKEYSPLTPSTSELQSVMPEGDSFKEKKEPFLYYEVYKNRRLIGYCFNTKDASPDEKGYGGPIEILVGLDKLGDIRDLKVLHHNETSQYAQGIVAPDFLDQFKGKSREDNFIIDGITHATISSKAVARSLKAGLVRIEEVISGFKEKEIKRSSFRLDRDFYITVLIITFLLIAFYLKNSLLRHIGLFLSIVYFGFTKANFISMSNLGSIFLWRVPSLMPNVNWYIFIFSGITLTFLFGKFYCNYMCPFGGIQIFLNKIFKFNIEITSILANRLRKVRFFLLWALTILILVLNNPNVANYEPFSTVFLRKGSIIAWSIALVILGLSLFHNRVFCNYFCSAGAFLEVVSKWGRKVFKKR